VLVVQFAVSITTAPLPIQLSMSVMSAPASPPPGGMTKGLAPPLTRRDSSD
jgi:hypothetical protein